jgi:hypothetical protein
LKAINWDHINEETDSFTFDYVRNYKSEYMTYPYDYSYEQTLSKQGSNIDPWDATYPKFFGHKTRTNAKGCTLTTSLINPDAIELPLPISGVVKVPDCYSGSWIVEIVDEYYCVMQEHSATF